MEQYNVTGMSCAACSARVEKDAYCPDILFQASAVSKALDSFCKELLGQHIRTCVVDDLQAGHYEAVDELVRVIQRLMK